jgi:hypothetical protein
MTQGTLLVAAMDDTQPCSTHGQQQQQPYRYTIFDQDDETHLEVLKQASSNKQ